jgi:hypothetical protein
MRGGARARDPLRAPAPPYLLVYRTLADPLPGPPADPSPRPLGSLFLRLDRCSNYGEGWAGDERARLALRVRPRLNAALERTLPISAPDAGRRGTADTDIYPSECRRAFAARRRATGRTST